MEITRRERVEYAARCDVIRTERHRRALLIDAEEDARRGVCNTLIALAEALRRIWESESSPTQQREKEHYAIRLHRNPHSPVPNRVTVFQPFAEKLQEHTRAPQPGPSPAPLAKQTEDLLLWEEENRQDLQAWEAAERGEMACIMAQILLHQQSRERSVRVRLCEGVLNGATVLEWGSYPSYSH